MSTQLPCIVEKLPEFRERILAARQNSKRVEELCQDYDTIQAALTGNAAAGASVDKEVDREIEQELIQLANELEKEMITWLQSPHSSPCAR
jgi:hypothetical protein